MNTNHEYTIDGLGRLYEQMETEPDVALRLHWLNEYVDAARQSWQYAADQEYRGLIDRQAAIFARHDEKVSPLYALELKMEMLKDQLLEMMTDSRDGMLRTLLPAYQSGNRDERLLYYLRELITYDLKHGRYDAGVYGGITLADVS